VCSGYFALGHAKSELRRRREKVALADLERARELHNMLERTEAAIESLVFDADSQRLVVTGRADMFLPDKVGIATTVMATLFDMSSGEPDAVTTIAGRIDCPVPHTEVEEVRFSFREEPTHLESVMQKLSKSDLIAAEVRIWVSVEGFSLVASVPLAPLSDSVLAQFKASLLDGAIGAIGQGHFI
jgi:hypothetical protein